MTGVDFVRRIAKQTLKINHQPDIDIRLDQVTLTLTTHDEGGITEKDFCLAQEVRRDLFQIFSDLINADFKTK